MWALDRNQAALQLGAEICGRSGYALSIREWHAFKHLPVEGQFDLIVLGYALEELFPTPYAESQVEFVLKLLERLTLDGHLLLVENSWTRSNRRLLALRDQLVKQGIAIQAPLHVSSRMSHARSS